MKTILQLDTSASGEASISRKLTHKLMARVVENHPDYRVIYHDLAALPVPHLSSETLTAFFTPQEQRTPALEEAIKLSDQLTDELLEADIVVVGAPMWNLGIPSALKAWIDHVVRAGKTFRYTAEGPQGLVSSSKKVIVVSSRGGIYTQGPAQGYDFQETYLKTIFNFLGIMDVSFIRAEGVSMGEAALEAAMQTAEAQLIEVVKQIAA